MNHLMKHHHKTIYRRKITITKPSQEEYSTNEMLKDYDASICNTNCITKCAESHFAYCNG